MNALDEHGRQIPDEPTGTQSTNFERTHQPYCAHGWTFRAVKDGYNHRFCALCGKDLGLADYVATNTGTSSHFLMITHS